MFSLKNITNSAARRVLGVSQHFMKRNLVQCKDVEPNHFKYGSHVIPHPEKVAKGGEDAFSVNDRIIAVADGVGGWADAGVDPANYSKELCRHITDLITGNSDRYVKNPKTLIIEAAKKTKSIGSSTLCVVTLDNLNPILRSSYIGDSGYVIYRMNQRNLEMVYQSEEHQRDFNFPYQIGTHGDPPSMSLEYTHKVKNNDIVVVGSDGLFDNLDQKQIGECVKLLANQEDGEIDSTKTAQAIAQLAYKYSLDQRYASPFAKRAKQYRLYYLGGKSDDITVVVGQVKLAENIQDGGSSGSSGSSGTNNTTGPEL